MPTQLASTLFLGIAAIPFIYYGIVLFSCWRFFRRPASEHNPAFAPPVSILKPIRGLDPEAYENFASFCRLDYPEYEILFCVSGRDDDALPLIERLISEYPERQIRVLFGSGRDATNDKVAKLARLTNEARYEHVVISDSDVRVRPDYLRKVVAPLGDPTIATTRTRLAGFGGYEAIENRPADDLLVGRLIADQGVEVELSRYPVETVADYGSFSELLHKRLRWIVVMRHLRPWGHFGLIFTHGLAWSIAAVAVHPTLAVAAVYMGGYFAVRCAIAALIAGWGLGQRGFWSELPLIPLWDAVAFAIWSASFARRSIRWRGSDYYIRGGALVPVNPD
jgi:ceramide glucosyltransferase